MSGTFVKCTVFCIPTHLEIEIGIPPNIKTSNNITMIQAIIRGIKNLKIARVITAISAITKRDRVDPLKGSMSITTSNINFETRIIGIISIKRR